jgi:hypothetical protein
VRELLLRLTTNTLDSLPFTARHYLFRVATQFYAAQLIKQKSQLLINRGPHDQAAKSLAGRLQLKRPVYPLPKALADIQGNQARLWLGAHLIGNRFLLELLSLRGIACSLVAQREHLPIKVSDAIEIIEPDASVYLSIRSHLKRHRTVLFTLDQWQPFNASTPLELEHLPKHVIGLNYHINQQALQFVHRLHPSCQLFLPVINPKGQIDLCFEPLDVSDPVKQFSDRLRQCVQEMHLIDMR